MSHSQWLIQTDLSRDATRYIEDQLNDYNIQVTGYDDFQPIGLVVRDDQGSIIAGLTGYIWGGFCEIEFLWVHPEHRREGLGRRLLAEAEMEAARQGCRQAVLDTYSFQAPDFYRKMGYTQVGVYTEVPTGYQHYHLVKSLE